MTSRAPLDDARPRRAPRARRSRRRARRRAPPGGGRSACRGASSGDVRRTPFEEEVERKGEGRRIDLCAGAKRSFPARSAEEERGRNTLPPSLPPSLLGGGRRARRRRFKTPSSSSEGKRCGGVPNSEPRRREGFELVRIIEHHILRHGMSQTVMLPHRVLRAGTRHKRHILHHTISHNVTSPPRGLRAGRRTARTLPPRPRARQSPRTWDRSIPVHRSPVRTSQ